MKKLEKVTTPKTLNWFGTREELLRFDLAVQRGEKWSVEQKSLLIHSLMVGFPVPPIYSVDRGSKEYWILDGQQRLRAVSEFMNDRLVLVDVPDVEGEVVEGKVFSELSEELQEELKKLNLMVFHYKNLSDDEIEELFYRLNNGKALTPIERTRAASGYLLERFSRLEHHGVWDHVSMTDRAKDNHRDMEVMIQTMMLIEGLENYSDIGSGEQSKAVRKWRSDKETFEKLYEKIEGRLDQAEEVFEELMKKEKQVLLKKSHLPVWFTTIDLDVVEKDTWVRKLKELAEGYKESRFAEVSKSGSTKKDTVERKLQLSV